MTTQKVTVAQNADQFETALKSARVDGRLHEPLWDIWVENPTRASILVRRLAPPPAVTVKAAEPQHPVDALALQLAATLRAKMGDEQVMQWFQQQIQGAAKATTKAVNTRFVDDFGRPLARFIRDDKGKPLP